MKRSHVTSRPATNTVIPTGARSPFTGRSGGIEATLRLGRRSFDLATIPPLRTKRASVGMTDHEGRRAPVGMTTLGLGYLGKSSLRSRSCGFMARMRVSFFSRRQRLICFSRLIALRTSPNGSKYTRRTTSYFFVNPGICFCLCWATRRSR
jgi:hypothetical protein